MLNLMKCSKVASPRHVRAVGVAEAGEHPEGHAEAAVDETLDVDSEWCYVEVRNKILRMTHDGVED